MENKVIQIRLRNDIPIRVDADKWEIDTPNDGLSGCLHLYRNGRGLVGTIAPGEWLTVGFAEDDKPC